MVSIVLRHEVGNDERGRLLVKFVDEADALLCASAKQIVGRGTSLQGCQQEQKLTSWKKKKRRAQAERYPTRKHELVNLQELCDMPTKRN